MHINDAMSTAKRVYVVYRGASKKSQDKMLKGRGVLVKCHIRTFSYVLCRHLTGTDDFFGFLALPVLLFVGVGPDSEGAEPG